MVVNEFVFARLIYRSCLLLPSNSKKASGSTYRYLRSLGQVKIALKMPVAAKRLQILNSLFRISV